MLVKGAPEVRISHSVALMFAFNSLYNVWFLICFPCGGHFEVNLPCIRCRWVWDIRGVFPDSFSIILTYVLNVNKIYSERFVQKCVETPWQIVYYEAPCILRICQIEGSNDECHHWVWGQPHKQFGRNTSNVTWADEKRRRFNAIYIYIYIYIYK